MAGRIERLIQYVLRGKDELSPEAKKGADALEALRIEGDKLRDTLDDANTARGLIAGLGATERAAERASGIVERVEQTAAALRAELDQNPSSKGLTVALREAEKEAARARQQLDQLTGALAEQQQAAKDAGVDTGNLSDEEARLAAEVEQAKRALAEQNRGLSELERQQAAAARAAAEHTADVEANGQSFASAGKKVLAFAAAYITVDAAIGLVKSGLGLVRDGIAAVFKEGSDGEQALGQLEAALISTGNAAGLNAEQLLAMADQLRDNSQLTTEQIIAAQTRLLSYTDVAGTEFPRAMQVIIDQQQRLGISVEQSAEIVGKALQSPAEAMTALGRQGFKLADGQKQLLERLVATGKKAEAQAVIMDMLSEAYGGSAAAARLGTFSGLWKTITDQLGDFAGTVAASGSFDYIKGKLQEVGDYIKAMVGDGRLDALAKALSDAFIQGAERVEVFAKKLLEVDFTALTNDSAAWLSQFGEKVDTAVRWTAMLAAPFRVVGNALTGFVSGVGVAFTTIITEALGIVRVTADLIPNMLGGEALRKGLKSAQASISELRDSLIGQFKQDGEDLKNTWNSVADSAEESAERQVNAVESVAKAASAAAFKANADMRTAAEQVFTNFLSNITDFEGAMAAIQFAETVDQLQLVKVAVRDAFDRKLIDQAGYESSLAAIAAQLQVMGAAVKGATDAQNEQAAAVAALKQQQAELLTEQLKSKGPLDEFSAKYNALTEQIRALGSSTSEAKVSITSLQEAQDALTTTSTVQGYQELQAALFKMRQEGKLTQEQHEQLHNAASVGIQKLNAAAGKAAPVVDTLSAGLKNLADVQSAIRNAKTDQDISAIQAALKKLYSLGKIDAATYNAEVAKTSAKQKELKGALEQTTKAQQGKTEADKEALVTSEQLRRESGKRMEAERRAGDQAMQDRRKGVEEVKRDVTDLNDFFGGALTRAREPLAEMSEAALEAFDKLQGLSTVDLSLDTSSVDATTASLEKAIDALGEMQAAAGSVGMSGFGRFMTETAVRSQTVQVEFLKQKLALQELMDSYERGGTDLNQFVASASTARRSLNLLNDSDLRTLEGAIDSAKQRMQSLDESTRNTLQGLRMELLQLKGTEEEIEKARFDSRKREIQAQIADARQGGDGKAVSNLQEALRTLGQIEAETANKRDLELRQKRFADAQKTQAPTAPPAPQQQAPGQVIRLETRGRAVDLTVQGDAQKTALLDILADAGLRSL